MASTTNRNLAAGIIQQTHGQLKDETVWLVDYENETITERTLAEIEEAYSLIDTTTAPIGTDYVDHLKEIDVWLVGACAAAETSIWSERDADRNDVCFSEEEAVELQADLTDEDDQPAIVAETWYASASWGIGGNGENIFPLYKDRAYALQDLGKRWTKQILENAGERLINPVLAWTREEAQEVLNEYLEEQADD